MYLWSKHLNIPVTRSYSYIMKGTSLLPRSDLLFCGCSLTVKWFNIICKLTGFQTEIISYVRREEQSLFHKLQSVHRGSPYHHYNHLQLTSKFIAGLILWDKLWQIIIAFLRFNRKTSSGPSITTQSSHELTFPANPFTFTSLSTDCVLLFIIIYTGHSHNGRENNPVFIKSP